MKKPKLASLFDFDEPKEPTESIAITAAKPRSLIPSVFPTISGFPYRIAILGDYPREADIYHNTPYPVQGTPDAPYSGSAGRELTRRLSQCGIVREACFIGFVTDLVDEDLITFNPHIILLLGKTSLEMAKRESNLDAWRGSYFISPIPGPFFGRKCIATYTPYDCFRNYEWMPLFYFDIKKCKASATTPDLVLPQRDLRIKLSVQDTLNELDRIKVQKPTIALDIEGYVDAMSCLSISPSPDYAFIVPLATRGNLNYYDSIEDEMLIWRALGSVLEDPSIPKVLQNSLYDRFVLQYSYALVVRGVLDDTMLRHWELYCELEKSLGFQASIYTDEPYYKSSRKSEDVDEFHKYCCRDSAVTLEINQKLAKYLDPAQDTHYRFNMTLLNPLLYMENRGIRYDVRAAKDCLEVVTQHLAVLQNELDTLSGKGFDCSAVDAVVNARAIMGFKRDPMQPKKDFEEVYDRVISILLLQPVSRADAAFVSDVLGATMNIKSADFKSFLYDKLSLPKQYKINKVTKEKSLTSDYESLLKLRKELDK